MKRVIVIESEKEEYINRFADAINRALEVMSFSNEVELTHFKED